MKISFLMVNLFEIIENVFIPNQHDTHNTNTLNSRKKIYVINE